METTPPRCAQAFSRQRSRKPLNSFSHLSSVAIHEEEERTKVTTLFPSLFASRANTRPRQWICPKHLTSWCAKSFSESAKHTKITDTLLRSGVDMVAASHLAPHHCFQWWFTTSTQNPCTHLQHGWKTAPPDLVSDRARRKAHHDYSRFWTRVPFWKGHFFNAVYGDTLFELSENIKDCGARMMCNRGSRAPPWKHQSDSLHTNILEPVPITDVTCVEDEAIFITGTDNDSWVSNIKPVANMVDKTMPSHGIAVNWDPSKTEVIVLWAGKRTRGSAWGFAGERT